MREEGEGARGAMNVYRCYCRVGGKRCPIQFVRMRKVKGGRPKCTYCAHGSHVDHVKTSRRKR